MGKIYSLKKPGIITIFLLAVACYGFAATSSDVAKYQTFLDNLFSDKSCTELKAGVTADNLGQNESYQNLPDTLKMMAMKIARNDWAESYDYAATQYNGILGDWEGDYAKKYRIQLYEPYSHGDDAASMAGITAYTNMNNPTGIVGDAGSTIYVMVEDAVPAGTSLYIGEVADYGLHDGLTSGTQLKQGLNVITCLNNNAHFFIYYSAPTVTKPAGSARFQPDPKYRLSDIPPIKIHIEGGRLNGFFNYVGDTRTDKNGKKLYTPDSEADFVYTVQRATNPMYDLMGRYVILHFHLFDTVKSGETTIKGVKSVLYSNRTQGTGRDYNPVNIMTAWDEMCLNERVLMGLQSEQEIEEYNKIHAERVLNDASLKFYSSISGTNDKVTAGDITYKLDPGYEYCDYFNNRLMGLSQDRDGLFMSATTWRMNFHINTVDAILTLFNQGDIWGPAHEYGHINQGPMNMAGTTEESNNIFSNVAVYFVGKQTSRSDFLSSEFKIFQDGRNFLDNGTWGTTRMFWQLWCYYHATAHNTKFYPRLYELLRNYPIQKVPRPGKHNMRYDQLQFAKMCCIAAEEDLTDFFTAWGFFVPMDVFSFEDYNAYDTYLTEADIKAVKDEIEAFGFPKNESIILIDDRPGVTNRSSYDGFPIEKAGKFGGLDAFRNAQSPEGTFSFTINMNSVTVTADGNPGAGYIIRDKEGNLLGFANTDTFEVSDELAAKLRSGEATVFAVGADNGKVEVTNNLIDGTREEKLKILNDIIAKAQTLLSYVDDDAVGYLHTEAAMPLKKLVEDAQKSAGSDDTTSRTLTETIDKLSKTYIDIVNNADSYVKLQMGNTYQITSDYYKTLVLTTDKTKLTAQNKSAGESLIQQWYFEPGGEDGTYYLKNVETGDYIKAWNSTNRVYAMSPNDPYPYDLQNKQNGTDYVGVYGIASHGTNQGLHYNNGMTYWSTATTSPASLWRIRKIHDATDEAIADKQKQMYYALLKSLIAKYDELKDNIDPTGSHVGYLYPYAETAFNSICDNIQSFIDSNDATATECAEYYKEQVALFEKTLLSPKITIEMEPGCAYVITNGNYHERQLNTDDTNVNSRSIYAEEKFSSQWSFEKTDSPDLYTIRNLGTGKYITSKGLSYTSNIPMKDTGDPYGLIQIPDTVGLYGISAELDPMNSLVMLSDDNHNIRLSMLSSKMGQWNLRKVHDRDYVEWRDRLAELIEHGRDLFWNDDYLNADPDAWVETYLLTEDGSSIYNSTSTTPETLKEWVENMENNLAYADALVNDSEIVTFESVAYSNDKVDENGDTDIIRHAFVPKGEIRFKKLIKLKSAIDVNNVKVEISPVLGGNWTKLAGQSTDLKNDYLNTFNPWETDENFMKWFNKAEMQSLDGFYTGASAKLQNSETSGVYDLIVDVPCSGIYEIKLYSSSDRFALFDKDKKVPVFTVEIYPNLIEKYGLNGINIEGYTFSDGDANHQKTIVLAHDYVQTADLEECRIYLPGIYFADGISASWVENISGGKAESITLRRKSSNGSVSSYFATIDLSSLKENSDGGLINVTVAKNGANANFAFNVKAANQGIVTSVANVESGEGDYIYYNLEGMRVAKPGKGVYIRIKNGKSEKVVL